MASLQELENEKQQLLKQADLLMAKKKKLFAHVDIESPVSKEEKELNQQISSIFSRINTIVIQKRELKKSEMEKFIIPYEEFISHVKGDIDLTKSRREHAEQMAKNYALENKKRVTERIIESFERDSGAYYRVRDILEKIDTRDFNDVIKKFKEYYPYASEDWKSALKTGLVIKADEKEGHYSNGAYIFNDPMATRIREAGINKMQPIIEELVGSEKFEQGGTAGKYPDLIEKAKQYLTGQSCLCGLLNSIV